LQVRRRWKFLRDWRGIRDGVCMKERPKSRSWMVGGENRYGVRLTVNGEQNMEDGGGKDFSLNDGQRG